MNSTSGLILFILGALSIFLAAVGIAAGASLLPWILLLLGLIFIKMGKTRRDSSSGNTSDASDVD